MAELLKCENGHYFDPDMYSQCPYCSGASIGVQDRGSTAPVGVTFGFGDPVGATSSGGTNINIGIRTEPVNVNGSSQFAETVPTPNVRGIGGEHTKPVNLPGETGKSNGNELKFVVGWLVAIEGPYKGKSFEVYNGYTSVGRKNGDIILDKDSMISAEKNISVVYAADTNLFYVTAGESRNVVYVNGEALISGSNRALSPYCPIKVGETRLLFVPFCCEKFKWSEEDPE